MKIENLITVTGVEEVTWNLSKDKRLSYSEWLELKSDRIAECFSGVKSEADVLPWISAFAEEFVRLSYEYGVTLQSLVDNFNNFMSVGLSPEMSLHRVKETLNIPGSYKLLMRGD